MPQAITKSRSNREEDGEKDDHEEEARIPVMLTRIAAPCSILCTISSDASPMTIFRACLALALLSVFARPSISRAETRPRLVVVVSVDQLAAEYLERFSPGFSEKGIFRLCAAHGAWFTNCHHRHAFTYTAPGHAVQLTGCYAP